MLHPAAGVALRHIAQVHRGRAVPPDRRELLDDRGVGRTDRRVGDVGGVQVTAQAGPFRGDVERGVVEASDRAAVNGGGEVRATEPRVAHRRAVDRAEVEQVRVLRIALDQGECGAPVIRAGGEVVGAVDRVDDPGASGMGGGGGALLTEQTVLGTQGAQRGGDELLGGLVGDGDDIGDRGLVLGGQSGFAHPPRETAGVVDEGLREGGVVVTVVGDDEGLGDGLECFGRDR